MSTQAESSNAKSGFNALKWVFAVVLLIAATLGNRYAPDLLPQVPAWARILLLVVVGLSAAGVLVVTVPEVAQGGAGRGKARGLAGKRRDVANDVDCSGCGRGDVSGALGS